MANLHNDASREWLDADVDLPFPSHSLDLASLCSPCFTFFNEPIIPDSNYFHFRFFVSLQKATGLGCRFCALVSSKIIGKDRQPAGELCLMYSLDGQGSDGESGKALEVWASYRTVSEDGTEDGGDEDWGGLSIGLVLEDGAWF
jgi:hypothetical protein